MGGQYKFERIKLTPKVMCFVNMKYSMRHISRELKIDRKRVKRIILEYQGLWIQKKDKRYDRKGKTDEQIYGKDKAKERRIKFIKSMKGKFEGDKNPMWKGGITPERFVIRNSDVYAEWRISVFERDNYTCQECEVRSGNGKAINLHAHHIKSFSKYPVLRFDVNNGITLCKDCHLGNHWDNYGIKKI